MSLKKAWFLYYWYFLNSGYKYEPEVCNGCHDTSMMTYELKAVDYRCAIWNMS